MNPRFKKFSIPAVLVFIGIIAIITALVIPRLAKAQPYFTNTTTQPGPYQYNDSLATPVAISTVKTNQAKAGIYTGAFGGNLSTNSATVTFGHTYSSIPVVDLILTNTTVAGGGYGVAASSVTVSNCTANYLGTNVGGVFIVIGSP